MGYGNFEETKDRYYEVLGAASAGWYEERNDPTPFIRYMLRVILACYTELEDRAGALIEQGAGVSAYETVKRYVSGKVGKFTSADVAESCPGIGRSSVLAALKRLMEEGQIVRYGTGRATFYVRADSL